MRPAPRARLSGGIILLLVLLLTAATACGGSPAGSPGGAGGGEAAGRDESQASSAASQASPAGSQRPAEAAAGNFPEKEITFIVPYSAGGGYDTLARAAAPVMSRNLPGQPRIVVQNITGGGGLIGPTTLYKAAPDGYTIGVMSGGTVIPQLIGKAEYDLNEFEWLGVLSVDYYITAASKASGFETVDDLRQASAVKAGQTGLTTIDGVGTVIMGEKMGVKVDLIGHKGSQEAILAAIRGDVDIVTYPCSALCDALDSGDLIPLWVSSPERMPFLPDTPTLAELGYPDLSKIFVLPRPVGAPPGVAPARLEILRKAFQAVLQDPTYRDLVINKNHGSIDDSGPEGTTATIADLFELLGPYKELLAEAWG